MAMTQEQFDLLVGQRERQAASNPTLYKFKLGAFASLGYAYIMGVLLVLIAACGAMIGAIFLKSGLVLVLKKLLVPVIVLIGLICKSLWVTFHPPNGMELKHKDFPHLFALIDEIRTATRAPTVHTVLLTQELNAAIVQLPRLGMFGWQKNFLILGLPLMQLLTIDEFKAVLAHEFGHLSGAHGRFGAWIYRIRASWTRLSDKLQENEHWGSFMFVPFFRWFAPNFAAYSFVQARRQEFEADALAGETVGGEALASALIRLDLKAEELSQNYWPGIYKATESSPAPDPSPYLGLMSQERRGFLPHADERLRQALQRETTTADTHPCLRARLDTLGIPATLPDTRNVDVAAVLLGDKLDNLISHFDNEWRNEVKDWWKSRHEHIRAGKSKLEFYAKRDPDNLSDVELFEYAQLVEEFDSPDNAFPLFKKLVLERGAKKGAKYEYGRHLLRNDDATGIQIIEEVMDEIEEVVLPGCEIIVDYLLAHERTHEIQPYIDRHTHLREKLESSRRELETIRLTDEFQPAELSPDSQELLKRVLINKSNVKSAYLVMKEGLDSMSKLHILAIERKSRMFWPESSDATQELIQAIANEVRIPEDILFIPLDGENKPFRKRFKKVSGSLFYKRPTKLAQNDSSA